MADFTRSSKSPLYFVPATMPVAARTGRSKREQLQDIIAQGVEDMEDYYLSAEVLKRVQQGQERVYSAEAVRRELGLEG